MVYKKAHLSLSVNKQENMYMLSEPMQNYLVFVDNGGRDDSDEYYQIMDAFHNLQKKYQVLPKTK